VGPAGLIKHMQTVNTNSCFTAPTILQVLLLVVLSVIHIKCGPCRGLRSWNGLWGER